eukprot:TRINITY_DN29636_c0_g1_i1.p1 TRINITY_DN29636_c0_g1~~TRINITY_DN29636_c0_g1_i1.p1  ORF type:complete len:301 (+),score=6.43 TRINITY_DN29636_c0_g1_i1:97-903(+)
MAVIIHGRSKEKCDRTMKQIADRCRRSLNREPDLSVSVFDLSTHEQVHKMIKHVQQHNIKLDVLILNAGVLLPERTVTSDGLETTFAVNHLSQFHLTTRLLSSGNLSSCCRIIVVSSHIRSWQAIDFEDLQCEKNYGNFVAYLRSKLANVWFTYALARRLQETEHSIPRKVVHCMEPGVIQTKLLQGITDGPSCGSAGFEGQPVEDGAFVAVWLATTQDPQVIQESGNYFTCTKKCVKEVGKLGQDQQGQEKLWRTSEDIIANFESQL